MKHITIAALIIVLFMCRCSDSEESRITIGFKNPMLSISEGSEVNIIIKSSRKLSQKDTVYIKRISGEALYPQDFTTSLLWHNDTLKIAGQDRDSVFISLDALMDSEIENIENVTFELVNFQRNLSPGQNITLSFDIVDTTKPIEFEFEEIDITERSESRIQLISTSGLNTSSTFKVRTVSGATTNTSDVIYPTDGSSNIFISGSEPYFDVEAVFDAIPESAEYLVFEITEASPGYAIGSNKTIKVNIINYNIGNNLVGEYLFNGNALDTSPDFENNGTIFGATASTDRNGNTGATLSFDGNNDYVSIPDNSATDFNSVGDFTISLWVSASASQSPNNSSFNDILRKWVGDSQPYPFSISYCSSDHPTNPNQILVANYDGSGCGNLTTSFSNAISASAFHHIVVVKSGTKLIQYIDNVKVSEVTSTVSCSTSNNTHITVGSRGQLVRFFTGKIDDLRFYNVAVTESIIAELFNETAIHSEN